MKIDIHTHTKKCKSGDAPTREISAADFCDIVLATEVRIIAITNHNVFDLTQFCEIQTRFGDEAQVWPGIELDVSDNGSRGHLLVIVSPRQSAQFNAVVDKLTKLTKPDDFIITVEEVLEHFDSFGPLYVAHYRQKKPNISDEALEKLILNTKNPSRVLKEVTNSISAGIYISHGHASIYGSDVHDWANYEAASEALPDLRLPVDSFEHFCLLLEKDPATINTLLNRKTAEELVLVPFGDSSILKIRTFNDINVIFGPKGTGKSCILKAIAKHYSENGIDARVYESASDRLDEFFDVRGRDLSINLNSHGLDYCSDEIKALRSVKEVGIAGIGNYVAHFNAHNTNRNSKKILLKDIDLQEESAAKRDFQEFNSAGQTTSEFLDFLNQNATVKKELSEEELSNVTHILSGLIDRLKKREWSSFSEWKEVWLLNCAIEIFRREVGRKTGMPAKPTSTGFRDYALNRITIEIHAAKVVRSLGNAIPAQNDLVGNLGSNKGDLSFITEFIFQDGQITDGELFPMTGVKKGAQKSFVRSIQKILSHAYSEELFQWIAELNAIEGVESINTIYELLLFKRYFSLNGQKYVPSNGESSMVMLQKELGTEKDIYILDEPERSLGNEYISEVIVPLLREHARSGKKVFISTHDANIAVRTLPYSSIYRCHGSKGYNTFIGNPFSNSLVNVDDELDLLEWKRISMKTLEGGEEAFGERGKIYGNH